MDTSNNFWSAIAGFLLILLSAHTTLAQTYNLDGPASNVKIEGTSNIHDWELTVEEFQGTLTIVMDKGELVKIKQLDFIVDAESLKSGKGGMDKNVYKALKTDDHKKIIFTLHKVNSMDCLSGTCKINSSGYLTIAGTKRPVDISFDAKISENKISLSGNKKINMTHYKVDPPTAMFGTITTGDEINVHFKTSYSK